MALRIFLENHSELFRALVAKWLSSGLWRLILSSGDQMTPKWSLEAHFERFWALVAKLLSGGLWRLILSSSGLWWSHDCSQIASGDYLILSGPIWPF